MLSYYIDKEIEAQMKQLGNWNMNPEHLGASSLLFGSTVPTFVQPPKVYVSAYASLKLVINNV